MKNIVWLDESECQQLSLVGGKVAPLAQLADTYPVPSGFCITTNAFDTWYLEQSLPATLQAEIIKAYNQLNIKTNTENLRVAVRSSGVDEDGENSSFAGQYETCLNVVGEKVLIEAVLKCWDSATSERVKHYNSQQDDKDEARVAPLAILVQQLVVADASGVAFTANPVTGNEQEIILDVNWGLGESIVGGTGNTDNYVIDKTTFEIKERFIGKKNAMTVLAEEYTSEVDIPTLMCNQPVITDQQAIELAQMAHSLEIVQGKAVDIECAWQDQKLFLLQCRPITTLKTIETEVKIEEEADIDFPIAWEDPSYNKMFWQHFLSHFPDQVTPLDYTTNINTIQNYGFNKAAEYYLLPFRLISRPVNTYLYSAFYPANIPSDQYMSTAEASEKKLHDAVYTMENFWDTKWLPEIKNHLTYWEEYDLKNASISDLLIHINETETRVNRCWELHFRLFFPMMLSISSFYELYQELFKKPSFDAYELLVGMDNKLVDGSIRLWELAEEAKQSKTIKDIVLKNPASEVMTQLKEAEGSQEFVQKLDQYLDEYGKKGDKLHMDTPFWIEDPTPMVLNLQQYMQQEKDMLADLARTKKNQQAKLAEARDFLKFYPTPVKQTFETLLTAAQKGYQLKNEHGYWIDSQVSYQSKCVLLEAGRRFKEAGLIDVREDVFYLTSEELKQTLSDFSPLQSLVEEQKAIRQRFAQITPPKIIGIPPSEPMPNTPIMRALYKMEHTSTEVGVTDNVLKGQSGSPGKVTGIARVINSLSEAHRLQPGDILVTKTTMPAWTPFFVNISGVITDTGGVLSHCAVIAREYAIPAVVATNIATTVIADGQRIELDGDSGVVRLLVEK
jgi:pyruvate,water dikinase